MDEVHKQILLETPKMEKPLYLAYHQQSLENFVVLVKLFGLVNPDFQHIGELVKLAKRTKKSKQMD